MKACLHPHNAPPPRALSSLLDGMCGLLKGSLGGAGGHFCRVLDGSFVLRCTETVCRASFCWPMMPPAFCVLYNMYLCTYIDIYVWYPPLPYPISLPISLLLGAVPN